MQTRTLLSLCGLAAALTALPTTHAVSKYAKLIPNGNGVTGVTAVGHTDPDSGGATNAFGKAFAAAGNAWTEALCKMDSDGDGQTNGEELGDPCCKWTAGATPAVPSGAKDPGSASSKLDDAALTAAKALCGGAAAPAAAPATAPGTVKPADGASNATPALTPGAPAATPAAGATPAAAPAATTAPATPGAAAAGSTTAGSDGYDWVPLDQMNKSSSSSTASASATTPSASNSSASSATNSSKNATSAAVGSPVAQRSALFQVVAAAVVGAVALAL